MSVDNNQLETEYSDFASAGEVEVGVPEIETNVPEEKPSGKKAFHADTPETENKEETEQGEEETEQGEEETEEETEGDKEAEKRAKSKQKASERIQQLARERRQDRRLIEQLSARLEVFEKGGLQSQNNSVTASNIGDAPNPLDSDKYPLGHLDDRYIEDRLEWLAEKKATERANTVLQRQQELEQTARAQAAQTELLEKVDMLSTAGSEIYEDFQELVVDSGMRGEWRLSQPTFEAASEADNGAQILYELSQDKKEAARVASLSSFQQLKYVNERDIEIGKTKQGRKIPKAGEPPATTTRGANSKTRINPATDNLDDFEKAWIASAKGK